MARLSGAARRKLGAEKAAAAGVHKSHYQTPDIRDVVQSELDAHRVDLANQRARVRGARLAPPKRPEWAAPNAQTNERAAALLEHIAEAT